MVQKVNIRRFWIDKPLCVFFNFLHVHMSRTSDLEPRRRVPVSELATWQVLRVKPLTKSTHLCEWIASETNQTFYLHGRGGEFRTSDPLIIN